MKRRFLSEVTAALLAVIAWTAPALAGPDAVKLYTDHCASCHGADRLGGQGPALLPENLGRLTGQRATAVIADGRAATQMPGFGATLDKDEIAALAAYIATPLKQVPPLGIAEISASRIVHAPAPALERPRFEADPMNRCGWGGTGDHHATILDGDRVERLARVPSRCAREGVAKFTPGGRYGWLKAGVALCV